MNVVARKASRHFLVFFLFALLTIAMTYPLLLHLNDHLPSDLGDPLHHVWLIGRNLSKIKQGFSHFFDAAIFYPHQNTLLYGDYVPAITLLAALPALFTRNLVLVYNLLWLLSFFLAALAAYFLTFHFTSSRWPSFLAGLIFAFSPIRFSHLSHLELLFSSWLPLCFLFLHRYIENPTWGRLSLALLFLIIQALSCGHYGIYAGLFMGLFGLILAFSWGHGKKPLFWFKTAAGIILSGLILLPFFFPYFPVHKKMGFSWSHGEATFYSAQIQHYLSVPSWNRTWGKLLETRDIPEHQLFLGFVPLAILLVWLVGSGKTREDKNYLPYFIKWLLAWFSWKKKGGGKKKTLGFSLLFIDSFIFILCLDILIILATGGFRFDFGNFHFSSRRLTNPLIFLVLLSVVRTRIYPGWKHIFQKLINLTGLGQEKKARREQLFPSPQDLSRRRDVIYDLYITMAIFGWLLSLGPVITFNGKKLLSGPYELLWRFFPGFQSMRVPSRFSVMVVLALSTLCGFALASFFKMAKRFSFAPWLGFLFAALIILEEISFPLPIALLPARGKIPPIYNYLAKTPADAVLLELPLPARRRTYYQDALPMYYSLFHGRRIVNGYSGFFPPAYSIIQEAMESFPTEETAALLKRLKVNFILVRSDGYRPEKAREIVTQLTNWSQDFRLVAQNEKDFLYEIQLDCDQKIIDVPGKGGGKVETDSSSPICWPRAENERGFTLLKGKESWLVWAGSNVTMASRAIDGSKDTGWSTADRQRRGDFFWVDFRREVVLAGVRLYLKKKIFDYPRYFIIEGSKDGILWEKIKEYENAFPYLDLETTLAPDDYYVCLNFRPARLRFFRIRLTRSHPLYHWSIQEIEAFGRQIQDGRGEP